MSEPEHLKEEGIDRILVEKAKQGEISALTQLFDETRQSFMGIIKSKVGFPSDPGAVEEIYQEACKTCIKNIQKCDYSKGSFYTFFARTVDFKIKQYFQRLKRESKWKTGFDDNELLAINMMAEIDEECCIYDLCLYILFNEVGKPHQVGAYCFNKLIYPEKYRTSQGKPVKIVEELSDVELNKLFDEFQKEYSIYYKKIKSKIIEPIYVRMKKVEKGEEIGKKCLRCYYWDDPCASISNWTRDTGKKLRQTILENYDHIIAKEYYILAEKIDKKEVLQYGG